MYSMVSIVDIYINILIMYSGTDESVQYIVIFTLN